MVFPQLAEGGSDGGYNLETVDDRGRETDRRRVDAIMGDDPPVKGLNYS